MRWEDHFAMASAGTHVLYRLRPESSTPVWVVMSVETGEPIKWICLDGAARAWMEREAQLDRAEIDKIMWGQYGWASRHLKNLDASACPACCE